MNTKTLNTKLILNTIFGLLIISMMAINPVHANTEGKASAKVKKVMVVAAPFRFFIEHTCPSNEDMRITASQVMAQAIALNRNAPGMWLGLGIQKLQKMAENTNCKVTKATYSSI